jgi:hypothetical protein
MAAIRRNRLRSRANLRMISLGIAVTCFSAALVACGGGGEEEAAGGNQAPTISGSPPAQALQGQQYTFTPTASDANGDPLTFTIQNTPAWATFNASTGQLSGTPTSAQVGMYSNIQIGVSDGTMTANLATFSINVVGTATGSATLSWNPPTQNTDGSPLTNLAGYRVYWGTAQNNLTNSTTISNPGLSSYVVDQLTPATWHFAVTALNSAGSESSQSNVASKQVL